MAVTDRFRCTEEQATSLMVACEIDGLDMDVVHTLHDWSLVRENNYVFRLPHTGPTTLRAWNRVCDIAAKLRIIC